MTIDILDLVWDEWNVGHIARHDMTPEEVEEVCRGLFIVRRTYKDRLMVIGPCASGRVCAVILEPEGEAGEYYVVTARPANRRERRRYATEITGGETP